MKEYIFYTPEGWTTPPNEEMIVENCQLLGFAKGVDKVHALKNLVQENPWIEECGFDVSEVVGVRVVHE